MSMSFTNVGMSFTHQVEAGFGQFVYMTCMAKNFDSHRLCEWQIKIFLIFCTYMWSGEGCWLPTEVYAMCLCYNDKHTSILVTNIIINGNMIIVSRNE